MHGKIIQVDTKPIEKGITQKDLDKINQTLKDHDIWHESGLAAKNAVAITIEWGDWKHDHAHVDYLLEQIGYKLITEHVTEENGSDCYSSIHIYEKK